MYSAFRRAPRLLLSYTVSLRQHSGRDFLPFVIMVAATGTDFLNSDFPMYAAGGVALSILYRAYVVSAVFSTFCFCSLPMSLLQSRASYL